MYSYRFLGSWLFLNSSNYCIVHLHHPYHHYYGCFNCLHFHHHIFFVILCSYIVVSLYIHHLCHHYPLSHFGRKLLHHLFPSSLLCLFRLFTRSSSLSYPLFIYTFLIRLGITGLGFLRKEPSSTRNKWVSICSSVVF